MISDNIQVEPLDKTAVMRCIPRCEMNYYVLFCPFSLEFFQSVNGKHIFYALSILDAKVFNNYELAKKHNDKMLEENLKIVRVKPSYEFA